MKYLFTISLLSILLGTGCGKNDAPETTASQKATAPEASQQDQVESESSQAASEIQKLGSSLMDSASDEAKKAVAAVASSVDWSNLSWNDVSSVPYDDKEKLLAWAAPQINELKEQLSKAAISKGKMSLANLGDSGWQGTIKNTLDALESVRNSSPETWEMARNALMTAWDSLQHEAAKYIGES